MDTVPISANQIHLFLPHRLEGCEGAGSSADEPLRLKPKFELVCEHLVVSHLTRWSV